VIGLLSKSHHVGFGVGIAYSFDVRAVVEDKEVCSDDDPQSARRSLQITTMDVCCHCKSKPWIGGICELRELLLYRMFVAYAADINGFNLMILFVDGCHLSGLHKRIMLAACALDADNHLFNFRTQLCHLRALKIRCGSCKVLQNA